MFTDMKEALEAEALELTPLGSDQSAAASVLTQENDGQAERALVSDNVIPFPESIT
ncbi:hypothetical protein [Streptomyces sp. NPDC001340]